jgi:hypothetical protein
VLTWTPAWGRTTTREERGISCGRCRCSASLGKASIPYNDTRTQSLLANTVFCWSFARFSRLQITQWCNFKLFFLSRQATVFCKTNSVLFQDKPVQPFLLMWQRLTSCINAYRYPQTTDMNVCHERSELGQGNTQMDRELYHLKHCTSAIL